MNLSLPWIIASVFSLALAGGTSYLWWEEKNKPPPFHPVWCDPQYEETSASASSRSPTRIKNNNNGGFEPATGALDQTQVINKAASAATAQIASGKSAPSGPPPKGTNPNFDRFVSYSISDADGSPIARDIRDSFGLDYTDLGLAAQWFVYESKHDGVRGFYRLALAYLDEWAFKMAKASPKNKRLYVPFCPLGDFVQYDQYWWNDWGRARFWFKQVEYCQVAGRPEQRWLEAMESRPHLTKRQRDDLDREALAEFRGAVNKLAASNFPGMPRDRAFALARDEFCHGHAESVIERPYCTEATTARQALKLGEASYADGDKDEARACWRAAIELGKADPDGAEPANQAQWRLQTMTTTCTWTPYSLAAITRDYEARSTDLITVKTQQHALTALGHYDGPINGQLGPQTRAAIRKYQRERSEDETDILTPLQITNLICNAAETTRDLVSENALGVMYTVGLGVEQNIDKAQQWLTDASNRRHADAKYNLALLYGTGIILDSYRLCDVPRAPEQAEKYMQEAAASPPGSQGQYRAMVLMSQFGPGSRYGSLSAPDRWMLIERQAIDKIRSGPFANRFQNIGKKCVSDGINR